MTFDTHGLTDFTNADRLMRGIFIYPLCRYDSKTGAHLRNSIWKYRQVRPSIFGAPDIRYSRDTISAERKPMNEGCVAVEHLRRYVMQYYWNLRRTVLSYNNFCATPNHAIIFDGEYTSIKRLCTS